MVTRLLIMPVMLFFCSAAAASGWASDLSDLVDLMLAELACTVVDSSSDAGSDYMSL